MKLALSKVQMQWFKAESAALVAGLVQAVGILFGWDISWAQGLTTVLAVYAGAYVTVKPE
jgi:hypothetical protein